ncbi:pyridoxine/pyridoxamine 5'-phosphate oxidase [Jiangella rhizosphaerae]|uniref:Oxidase n=1 Tax=Jiangella rhizosphaerae TaxID=2293569 RepID=A0A418KNY2_9ACTN|nr:pyridoxamine 5'-phosphate oxidase family protein [Jiangella rhizosphaerae]RIQ20836.1 oxidase [Jiangella rhizosphaerae]
MMANDDDVLNGVSGRPLQLLSRWLSDAASAGVDEPRTFTLATASLDGTPHARTVLAVGVDDASVRFTTSRPSVKTADLAANPLAAGVFFWPALMRQVTLHGQAVELPPDEARAAYADRSPNLRALAWVYEDLGGGSPGAAVDPDDVRAAFTRELDRDRPEPPPSWTAYALRPHRVEVWWMPGDAGVATRARFDLAGGEWTRRFVLP